VSIGSDPPATPRFLRQAFIALAAQLALLVLGGAFAVVAARTLGPSGWGQLATALLGPSIIAACFSFGLDLGNVFHLGRGEVEPGIAIGSSLATAAVVSVCVIPVYLSVGIVLSENALSGVGKPLIVAGALLIPFVLANRFLTSIAQGLRRISLMSVLQLIPLGGAVVLYLALGAFTDLTPFRALMCSTIAATLASAVAVVVYKRAYPNWTIDRSYVWKSCRFGLPGQLSNIMTFLNYRLDLFLVTGLVGVAAAGRYVAAFTAAELLWQVPGASAVVLFPRSAARAAEGTDATTRLTRLSVLLLGGAAIVGWFVGPILLPALLSEQFRASVEPFRLLLPGVALYGIVKLLSADLAGRGRPGTASITAGTSLIFTIALDIALIPDHGIEGAAVASTIAYSAGFLVSMAMFVRITKVRVGEVLIPRRDDIGYLWRAIRGEVAALRTR
jgi:O-antigen/teichoic acid export membrane protein